MNKYKTIQDDTWDLIAYRIWGSEYLFPLLLEVNSKYRDVVFFEGGIELNLPVIDTSEYTPRPVWLDEEEEL
ncbi:MAG: hypothetical protein ABS920_07220 [Sporosarcina sp.]